MSQQRQFKNSKYRNWVTGGLAYRYLKDGLVNFTDDVIQREHTRILGVVTNTSGNACDHCNLKTLQPYHEPKKDHTGRKRCPWGLPNCNCLYPKKTRCPYNICDVIMEEILKSHGSTPQAPNWKNTDVQKWYTSPWEIAKCFINAPGYSDKTSAADINAFGLLSCFINNKNLHAHSSCNMTGKNIFIKCREIRNKIFCSPTMELEDVELKECIADIIEILEDPKELAATADAQQAVLKLKQLMMQDFNFTTQNEVSVSKDALAFLETKTNELEQTIQEAKDDIGREDAGEARYTQRSIWQDKSVDDSQLVKTQKMEKLTNVEEKQDEKENIEMKMLRLEQELKETKNLLKLQEEHKEKLLQLLQEQDEKSKRLEERQNLDDHGNKNKPGRKKDKHFDVNLDAGTDFASKKGSTHSKDQTGSDKTTNWKQVDDHGYKIKPGREEDKRFDANLDADTASAPQTGITHSTDQTGSDKATKWTQDVNAWRMCIERSDKKEAERLICEKILPDHEMLNKASTSFGSDLQVLKSIGDEISSCIKAESNEIINVYAGYEHAGQEHVEENALVFAVITTSKSNIYVKNKFGYKLEQICIHEVNSSLENKAITLKERENPANKDEISKAEKVIIRYSQELMKKHKNITRISVSWIKSSRYGTGNASMDREVCISLYVPKKGLIPIDENLFPRRLDRFPVDVREGVCIPFLGPKEFHENIKIGCEISGPCIDNLYSTGTLGGIFEIENQDYGLTCAHVFLLNPDLQVALKKEGSWNAQATQDPSSINVYQPSPARKEFGSLKKAVLSEGVGNTSGVDAAYFHFQNRHPNSGLFPDANNGLTTGFEENNPMEFKFGKLSETVNYDDSVVKFGCETDRTNGIVRSLAGTLRSIIPGIGFHCFYNQYEIDSSDTTTFATEGDSGAMVFTVEDNELIGIGIVEGGMDDVCFVTPICGVLSALGVNPPYKMKTFVLDTG